MPIGFLPDWDNGPQGPGFLLYFRGLTSFFYDGGGMFDLIGKRPVSDEQRKKIGEIVALILLLRCR